jgi:hypothetical protein
MGYCLDLCFRIIVDRKWRVIFGDDQMVFSSVDFGSNSIHLCCFFLLISIEYLSYLDWVSFGVLVFLMGVAEWGLVCGVVGILVVFMVVGQIGLLSS